MPNREQRRQTADKPMPCIRVTVGGNPYEIYLDQIRGDQEQAYKNYSGGGTFVELLQGDISLGGIAGLVWAVRSPYEKKLTIHDVAKEVTLADLQTLEIDDGMGEPDKPGVMELPSSEPAGPEDPEGTAGSSDPYSP